MGLTTAPALYVPDMLVITRHHRYRLFAGDPPTHVLFVLTSKNRFVLFLLYCRNEVRTVKKTWDSGNGIMILGLSQHIFNVSQHIIMVSQHIFNVSQQIFTFPTYFHKIFAGSQNRRLFLLCLLVPGCC